MDRLTSKDYDGNNIIVISKGGAYYPQRNTIEIEGDVADKLAAYEDTGLSPNEVTVIKTDNERLHKLLRDLEGIVQKKEEHNDTGR